jgi:uncharacterized MAPEG superfamily protein
MSLELTYLLWSTALFGLYLGAQSITYRMQYGVMFANGARDEEPAKPNVLTARAERALRNFLETYAVFIALAVATELSGRSDGLTQWGAMIWFWLRIAYLPLYLAGVPYLRSLVWFVSAIGLMLMFLGVLL